jgi:Mannosyltransferase (PIG-V)
VPLRAFVSSRLIVWGAGVLAFALVPLADWHESEQPEPVSAQLGALGEVLGAPAVRWDSAWYVEIGEHGYEDRVQTAFFPLYPLLARIVGTVFGGSVVIGGIVVSLAAFAVALVLVRRLAALDVGEEAADRSVWLLALFPGAIFFSAVYTEAVFLAASVAAIYAARRSRWMWAGLLGAAAALTRNTGVLVLVPVALIYLYGPRDGEPPRPGGGLRPRYPLRRDALWLLLIPAGLLTFMAYTGIVYDDPFATMAAQGAFAREFAGPLSALWFGAGEAIDAVGALFSDPGEALRTLALTTLVVLALVATVGALRRLPLFYGAYALVALLPPLSTPWPEHPFWSTPRFIAVLFPLFVWAGLVLRDRRAYAAVLVVFVAGLIFASARFSAWYWVA